MYIDDSFKNLNKKEFFLDKFLNPYHLHEKYQRYTTVLIGIM